jgi:hypothetical protein
MARCRQETTGARPAFAAVREKAPNNCRFSPTTLRFRFDQKLKHQIQLIVF